jgi:AmmeMemoRadiSam system protein B/AmmeMemoRadiSam system protein A
MKYRLTLIALMLIASFLSGCQPKTKAPSPSARPALPVRPPAVAGQFYPADPEELKQQINQFLAKVPADQTAHPRLLIVPHAGYSFSGPVAAYAYKTLQGQTYSRVILIGPSHSARFNGMAIFAEGSWETPLGSVPVDQVFAQKLIAADPQIFANTSHHQTEHSLEVQLPFLQTVLTNFQIVPILLGQVDQALLVKLAGALAQHLDSSSLVIISSDLSHYPSYDVAKKVDQETIKAILTGKLTQFNQTLQEQEKLNYPNLFTLACGSEAIRVGLILAEKLNFSQIKLLHAANSGDVPPADHSQVVGYAAIGFYSAALSPDQKTLLDLARQTLVKHFAGQALPQPKNLSSFLTQSRGVFVTLTKAGQLRGCLGEFSPPDSLWQVVQRTAIAAATKDSRFPPVEVQELKDLKIEISVLSPKRKLDRWQDIQLGSQGVILQKGTVSGTFLPQVAQETGWGLEEFLSQLCTQKLGLAKDCYRQPDVTIYTYTAQVFSE